MVRGRFAPTPSGQLHIGNGYTALLAWLQVRSAGGVFTLRMEDIDEPRSRPCWAEGILSDLQWLGLDWDEGPDIEGPYAPYTQSERKELYETALNKLEQRGLIYPCYCSRAELLAVASAPHGIASEGPVYGGACRMLTAAERERREADKLPSYRFAVPADRPVSFTDGVCGTVTFPAGQGGDFVVKRADGIIGYQLAVVVDDAAMNISHVLRGADLLDSTPRQLWLYDALELTPPSFAHVPLLCSEDGERLSKRHKSLTMASLRNAGLQAEHLVGMIAYAAGQLDRPEPVQPKELIASFDLNKLPKSPIQFPQSALERFLR